VKKRKEINKDNKKRKENKRRNVSKVQVQKLGSNITWIDIHIQRKYINILLLFILFSYIREGKFMATSGSNVTHEAFSNMRLSS
jgi:hypothetical protein